MNDDPDPPRAATPWRAAILVCASCAAKRPGGVMEDGRTEARAWFRARLAAEGAMPAVRVAETTCLAVCPVEEGVTTLLVNHAAGDVQAFVVTNEAERERVLSAALRAARAPSGEA